MTAKTRKARKIRHRRVRRKISGTAERPRLNVFRSLRHIYVQVIDDTSGHTLAAASTVDKDVMAKLSGKNKKEQFAAFFALALPRYWFNLSSSFFTPMVVSLPVYGQLKFFKDNERRAKHHYWLSEPCPGPL